jgi:hypothetical protein
MLTYQADTCVPARVCFAAAPPPRVDPTGQTVQTQVPAAAWHVQEVDVFGEELGESLTADAPVWLSAKQGTKAATAPAMEAQTDHPPSAATDANLNTGFRTLAARENVHLEQLIVLCTRSCALSLSL